MRDQTTLRFGLFFDCGTGKTITALDTIKGRNSLALVVCPLSIIEPAWIADAKKVGVKVVNLWARNAKQRREQMTKIRDNGEPLVAVINYESFKKEFTALRMIPFKMLVIDESSKMKDPNSAITKKLIEFADHTPDVLLMSGRPAPNSILEYWSQMRAIERSILGPSFFAFRNRYFYQPRPDLTWLWMPKTGSEKEIMEKIKARCMFVDKKDALKDLPDHVYTERKIVMDPVQRRLYDKMLAQLAIELDGKYTFAANELAKLMKLRQITAGFVFNEEGEKQAISNTKIAAVQEILDEIGDEPVVIVCQFHWEVEEYLLKLGGEKVVTLYGENTYEQNQESIKLFTTGAKKILVGHPKSMGHGLTFTNCRYMIWPSLSYSYEEWYQANQRIHRIGQEKKCQTIVVNAKNSIDETVHKVLKSKGNINEALLGLLKVKKIVRTPLLARGARP